MRTAQRLTVGVLATALAAGAYVIGTATSASALPSPSHAVATVPTAVQRSGPASTDPTNSGSGGSGGGSSSGAPPAVYRYADSAG